MPHLKLVEPGFEKYTGLFGSVEFENGVSVDVVSIAEAKKLASVVRCEELGTGINPSISQELVDERGLELSQRRQEMAKKVAADGGEKEPEKPKNSEPTSDPVYDYDLSDLEGIADESGIEGLREFASKYDVRGGSIKAIIDSLMARKEESQKGS